MGWEEGCESYIDDYVALFKNSGIPGTGECCVFIFWEETKHIDGESLISL